MIALAGLIAWGTIVESQYDAEAAKKTVYDTVWMYITMGALSTSLIAVMVDRWPWKKRHAPFVLAHIGILVLLFGSVLSMKYGLDGMMSVEIGKSARHVVLTDKTDLLVYASFGGSGMTKLAEEDVDFFRKPPTEKHPVRIATDAGDIEIVGYKKYVLPSKKVVASPDKAAGPGLRFQIQNANVSVVEWLVQRRPDRPATHDFGPAKIHLGPPPPHGMGANEIYLTPDGDKIRWVMFRKDSDKPAGQGVTQEAGLIQTGWMGLELRILRYLPNAREEWELEDREAPTPLTTSAVKVRFQGREHWLLREDTLRLFTETTAYLVSYVNRRVDLGFPLELEKFEMIPYEGTNRAKEYQSLVRLPEIGETLISMNEPAKYNGLTFYQASFQNDDQGRPTASVFSVNNDPGRWFKYLGSLIITLGTILLFWNRRVPKPVPADPKERES